MQVALTIWELKEISKTLDEHRANRHMRWQFTRTKPPNEMAVCPYQTATSCDGLLVNANRHLIWRFCLEYFKKKKIATWKVLWKILFFMQNGKYFHFCNIMGKDSITKIILKSKKKKSEYPTSPPTITPPPHASTTLPPYD